MPSSFIQLLKINSGFWLYMKHISPHKIHTIFVSYTSVSWKNIFARWCENIDFLWFIGTFLKRDRRLWWVGKFLLFLKVFINRKHHWLVKTILELCIVHKHPLKTHHMLRRVEQSKERVLWIKHQRSFLVFIRLQCVQYL